MLSTRGTESSFVKLLVRETMVLLSSHVFAFIEISPYNGRRRKSVGYLTQYVSTEGKSSKFLYIQMYTLFKKFTMILVTFNERQYLGQGYLAAAFE